MPILTEQQLQDLAIATLAADINSVFLEGLYFGELFPFISNNDTTKLKKVQQYVASKAKPAIKTLITSIQEGAKLSEDESVLLTKMLNHEYILATLQIPYIATGIKHPDANDAIEILQKTSTTLGGYCLYEEFEKVASFIHDLSIAGMHDQVKGMIKYLISSPNNLHNHTSYKSDGYVLNINPNCYGLFGPALKSEPYIRNMWDESNSTWKDTNSFIPFSDKTPHNTYQVGHGLAIQRSDTHAKFFNLDEVLSYRQSIHTFFGDLMKLCLLDDTALDTLVMPVLNLLIRGEAEITIDFITTLVQYVPEDALLAAGYVITKFIDKMPDTPEPAEAKDKSDDEEEAAAEATVVKEELKPVEFLRACKAGADPTVLKMFSGNVAALEAIINTPMGDDGKLPLGAACEVNNLDAAKNLIALGANPKAKDGAGKTAVEYLPKDGNTNLAQIFVDAGVEIPADAPVFAAYKEATSGRLTPISALCYKDLLEMENELNASEVTIEDLLKACKQAKTAYIDAETATVYKDTIKDDDDPSIESLLEACITLNMQHENAIERLGENAGFDTTE